jgi:hypothetical protein
MKYAYPLLLAAILPLAGCSTANTDGAPSVGGYSAPVAGFGGLSAMNAALNQPSATSRSNPDNDDIAMLMVQATEAEGMVRACPGRARIAAHRRNDLQAVLRFSGDTVGWSSVASHVREFEGVFRANCSIIPAYLRQNPNFFVQMP